MLRQPGNYCLLLHIGSCGNINDEVTQFLPMPIKNSKEELYLTMFASCELNFLIKICLRLHFY